MPGTWHGAVQGNNRELFKRNSGRGRYQNPRRVRAERCKWAHERRAFQSEGLHRGCVWHECGDRGKRRSLYGRCREWPENRIFPRPEIQSSCHAAYLQRQESFRLFYTHGNICAERRNRRGSRCHRTWHFRICSEPGRGECEIEPSGKHRAFPSGKCFGWTSKTRAGRRKIWCSHLRSAGVHKIPRGDKKCDQRLSWN